MKKKCGGGDDISPCTLISSLSYDIILCALHSILYIYNRDREDKGSVPAKGWGAERRKEEESAGKSCSMSGWIWGSEEGRARSFKIYR